MGGSRHACPRGKSSKIEKGMYEWLKMNNNPSLKLPKALRTARDAREIFGYLFRKAALWPESGMAPQSGIVRRIVLLTEGFNDRTVDVLERIPNVSTLVEGLEEL